MVNAVDNRNIINRTENLYKDKVPKPNGNYIKPVLTKSKSSHDFAYIRSKFDRRIEDQKVTRNNENQRKNDTKSTSTEKIASLYTEPVPKSLRNKPNNVDIHNADTLKICDTEPVQNGEDSKTRPPDTLDSKAVPTDTLDSKTGLTDTLKAALRRPLPQGPAPVKPPRTFEHTPVKLPSDAPKNSSFLHREESKPEPKPHKHDPRYMLNKLENALRNNKLRRTKKQHEASTTSGEDSDDSVLFKSKSKRELPDPPTNPQNSFNFNCLNGLTLCQSTYETIKEPNSSFFVSCKEEPVYAEPFNFAQDNDNSTSKKSLYYLVMIFYIYVYMRFILFGCARACVQ
ncbi:hypothetical protein BDFB_012021 [Asbolus verrucosus]|uniref:Uncharacterized protein n=1 Tax=Asbolus verrucosus TaxID=1661398 RepID=A0A482W4P9_ASBVE|nr:hypothetical protein BDFB_012021 [Asbolus verrucosus]